MPSEKRAWRVSDMVRLTGLSRRDIQRCCYTGPGGLDILSPQDSGWGRRTYDRSDLTCLFLVSLLKDRCLTLPDIAALVRKAREEEGVASCLRRECQRLREAYELNLTKLVIACALCADGGASDDSARLLALLDTCQRLAAAGPGLGITDVGLDGLPEVEFILELLERTSESRSSRATNDEGGDTPPEQADGVIA